MDAWNFIAFGGLERIVIIGAATLIGYWGYRIFASNLRAGLTLITVAALVLVGALLTTGAHLDRLNDTLVASNARTPVAPPPASPPSPFATPAPVPAPAMQPAVEVAAAADASEASSAPAGNAAAASDPELAQEENARSTPQAAEDARVPRIVPLASGQELGGRITSVRSENVTLEWSPEATRRRVISSSGEP